MKTSTLKVCLLLFSLLLIQHLLATEGTQEKHFVRRNTACRGRRLFENRTAEESKRISELVDPANTQTLLVLPDADPSSVSKDSNSVSEDLDDGVGKLKKTKSTKPPSKTKGNKKGKKDDDPTVDDEEGGLNIFIPENEGLILKGLSSLTFNAAPEQLEVELLGAEYSDELSAFEVAINGGENLEVSVLSLSSPTILTVSTPLSDGLNLISVKAFDVIGRPIYLNEEVWIGSNTVSVSIVDLEGEPKVGTVKVTAAITDNLSFGVWSIATDGEVTFVNIPSRTMIYTALSNDDLSIGSAAAVGESFVTITLIPIGGESDVDNNDFSLGSEGWDVEKARDVNIVVHEENVGPVSRRLMVNNDLVISTGGVEGPSSVSRSFSSQPEACAIKLRYRFITSEVPGGFFGSQFNDYFRVAIRSLNAGGIVQEVGSMNGLGLAAFDAATGSTAWREALLPLTNDAADTVQTDILVANVADEFYDSYVVIDFIEEVLCTIQLDSLKWNPTLGGLDLFYTVKGEEPLPEDVTIEIFGGPAASLRTVTVSGGTLPGMYGPINTAGMLLETVSADKIEAVSGTSRIEVADVSVTFGPSADAGAVSAAMLEVVKDGLRVAGQSVATITSTARTPEDQARAMFNNLVKPGFSIQANIADQLALYASSGDQVVQVFAAAAAGLTRQQILAQGDTIKQAMVTKINELGPSTVSKHCADPAVLSVVDVGAGAFTAANKALFSNYIATRVDNAIFEPKNNCFHLELSV